MHDHSVNQLNILTINILTQVDSCPFSSQSARTQTHISNATLRLINFKLSCHCESGFVVFNESLDASTQSIVAAGCQQITSLFALSSQQVAPGTGAAFRNTIRSRAHQQSGKPPVSGYSREAFSARTHVPQ